MKSNYKLLKESAKAILIRNNRGDYTKMHSDSEEIQDSWQSAFIALAKSTFDLEGTIRELKSVFSGQWKNGLLPHQIFHNQDNSWSFPTPQYWNNSVNESHVLTEKTTGIIPPPVFGIILKHLLEKNPESINLQGFVKETFPKVVQFHDFIYFYRDAHLDGLASMYHPEESGNAGSILWDKPLSRLKIKEGNIAKLLVEEMNADSSALKERYERYIHQIELGKRYSYDGEEILESSRFLIQDCMVNALLIASNDALIEIGKRFDFDTDYLEECNALSKKFYSYKFWNDYHQCFMSFDLASNEPIEKVDLNSFMPLYAGLASQEQALKLVEKFEEYIGMLEAMEVSILDNRPEILWMICKGLIRYGYSELADSLKNTFLESCMNNGLVDDSVKSSAIINLGNM